jgi:hypothetical protein
MLKTSIKDKDKDKYSVDPFYLRRNTYFIPAKEGTNEKQKEEQCKQCGSSNVNLGFDSSHEHSFAILKRIFSNCQIDGNRSTKSRFCLYGLPSFGGVRMNLARWHIRGR